MRILFTCRPAVGHYYPMRPLMEALSAAGDEVAIATGQPLLGTVEADGFTGFRAGLDDSDPIIAHHREILAALPPTEIRRHAFTEFFVRAEVPKRVEDLRSVVESFKPDLVVHEMAEFAGPIAAAAYGVPYATHSFGPLIPPDVAALAGEAAAPFWQAHGLDPHPTAGLYEHLYLDICPPSLHIPAISDLKAIQPIGQAKSVVSAGALPWLDEFDDRPIVYVSLGTVWNRNVGVFEALLEGIRGERLNVVVTVGSNNDPSMLGPQPPNVVVRGFIPQGLLLPRCSAVITHGGAGSALGALSFGLPLLVVPQSADQFYNATLISAAGAGEWLAPADLNPDAVRSALSRVLGDPKHREAARRIKEEFDAMPQPAAVRPRLVDLATCP
jgi:UDP:flavonoid glycosyltransferase YjiC (YdhE family)